MITEFDLDSAIAECQGAKNPNANTCIKLAAYYTIKKELFGDNIPEMPLYSHDSHNAETITYSSGTEFAALIDGRNANDMWAIMDELMTMLQMLNPRLYNSVMRKIEER